MSVPVGTRLGTHALERVLSLAPPRQIDDVIARLKAIVRALPPTDGVAAFTALYLAVTEAVNSVMRTQRFEDARFARSLDVTFANLYLDALRRFAAGDGSIPNAWAALVEARARRDVLPLQFALAGMNAHINRDLPVALVTTWEALGLEPSESSPQRRDFRRVDAVLAQTEARVKGRFVTGVLAETDAALGGVDDCIAMWNVGRAREAAWVNAEALWALRDAPQLSAEFLCTLDRIVGFAGRGLLRPLVSHA